MGKTDLIKENGRTMNVRQTIYEPTSVCQSADRRRLLEHLTILKDILVNLLETIVLHFSSDTDRVYFVKLNKIHLLRFINWYCTSIYKKYVNLLCFICPSSQHSAYLTNNHHKTFLITQISNQFLLWYFQRPFFAADTESTTFSKAPTVQTQKTKKYAHTEKTLKDGALSGVFRLWDILIQQKFDSVKRLFG